MSMTAARLSQAPASQPGVALIAVLWIVAALSIIVTGLVKAQRDEIRTVSTARQALEASALGNAAIQLVLQRLSAGKEPVTRLSRVEVTYESRALTVEIMPLNGLIDPNRAPGDLLTALFLVAGGVDGGRAAALAQAVAAARTAEPAAGRTRFEAPEDLLQVPGVDYDLYARLAPLLTTDAAGSGLVNAMAAPLEVLLVLAGGNAAEAARIAADRDAMRPGIDTTRLNAAFIDATASRRWRLQARVPMADGKVALVTRSVQPTPAPTSPAPWRILQADERFEPATQKVN
jgi:general secretion pathway protein K